MSETPYAVVVGGTNMDILGRPDSPLKIGDSNPGIVRCSAGGVGRNIAENLARLGSDTHLISVVGNDAYGQALITQCRNAGIDIQNTLQLENAATSTYLSILDGNNDLQVAISDMKIIEQLTVEHLKPHQLLLENAKLIVLDANLSEATLNYLLHNFCNTPLFVDTVSSTKALKIKPYLDKIHTLKPNLGEAEQLSGITLNDQKDLPTLANWFHEEGVQRIFLSLGAEGVFYSDRTEQVLLSVMDTTIVNANGAGDALLAGLVHGYMQDWSIHYTQRFAIAAAAVALSDLATINPAMSETTVKRLIEDALC